MRIITGSARGTNLLSLDGNSTRPTAERAKEALFSIIQFDIEGRRVLDLFAGSGQLGLEALSRYAASATFVDSSEAAMNIVMKNAEKTHLADKCRFIVSDFKKFLLKEDGKAVYDFVFIDPPYSSDFISVALETLARTSLLNDGALVICEHEADDIREIAPDVETDYNIVKTNGYGRVHLTFLSQKKS